ncbi:MAG: tRNA (adenosine(37)-N6)-threonylcarbamoyltransferase complex ATPase subunit type 1 TsaE [Bacteroidales bacterium]|nr:tRNA (adenosine(37)-N6)-threonylcarbamoyltransferase complex ATPase subunit type 1 TsaE [Bacteroidales bacterium]
MTNKVEIRDLNDLDRAAAEFIAKIGDNRLIAFYAPLGSGKTTFTAALCKRLGVEEVVNSPTFTILNEYRTADGDMIYHFDFYRIKELREAVDIGLDDYLYSGRLCLMEWPENVEDLLPEETLKVRILVNPDLSRTLVWES